MRRSNGFAYALRTTETLQDWLDNQHARCSLLAPVHMPMVVRPRRWRSPTYGGYLTPRHGNRFVKQRNAAYHQEARHMDLSRVYDSVNHIQDSPWRINSRVLEVMDAIWKSGGTLGGLPDQSDVESKVPAKPVDFEENEEAKLAWKRAAAEAYEADAELRSARLSIHQGLWMARRFADEKAIYFPHELDFRGRV